MATLDPQTLAEFFRTRVNVLATMLIEAFGLKYKKEVSHLSSPLMRWAWA